MAAPGDWIIGARIRLFSRLKRHPRVFLPIARLRETPKRRVVRRSSDIVIEGYTRCGNHPAVFAFLVAQGRPMEVAHHFHAPAPLMLAADWGVPAVLLIRDPIDAVSSGTMYFHLENPAPLLRSYIDFHAPLVPYVDRLVASDFPVTVNDFGAVIAEVNRKFHVQFRAYAGTPAEQADVERRIREEHARNMGGVAVRLPWPTAEKDAIKRRIAARILEPRNKTAYADARQLYDFFAARSVRGSVTAYDPHAAPREAPPATQNAARGPTVING